MEDTKEETNENLSEVSSEMNTGQVNDNVGVVPKSKRGRKSTKKDIQPEVDYNEVAEKLNECDSQLQKSVSDFSQCVLSEPNSRPNLRGSDGLLKNVNYIFDEYGFVNWRAMIKPEHVVLNKNAVVKTLGRDYNSLTDAEKKKYLEEWPDSKKVILLAGFKDVARLRGYKSIRNEVQQVGDKVIVSCTIYWANNFENPGGEYDNYSYTAVASAAPSNVAPEYSQFLEAIACNRAFCRAVRESLGIHVVSEDELDPNKTEEVKELTPTNPKGMLKKLCKDKGVEFDTVKAALTGMSLDNSDWVSFETLTPAAAMAVLDKIRTGEI